MTALFYVSSAVAVVAALLAVTRTNALHGLLYLILALFGVALGFLSLGAPFVAALEVIVYAGAIMVLILFVIMMLDQGAGTAARERRWLRPHAWVVPGILATALLAATLRAVIGAPGAVVEAPVLGPEAVGTALFTTYVVAVELAAVLLLAGLVGAWWLGSRQ